MSLLCLVHLPQNGIFCVNLGFYEKNSIPLCLWWKSILLYLRIPFSLFIYPSMGTMPNTRSCSWDGTTMCMGGKASPVYHIWIFLSICLVLFLDHKIFLFLGFLRNIHIIFYIGFTNIFHATVVWEFSFLFILITF